MTKLRVLLGMESSGVVRRAMQERGHEAISCDLLSAQDDSQNHIQGDVFDALDDRWDIAIFHPTCTYLTDSAAWAFQDPDFARYPGVGYHQAIKGETLTGLAPRQARNEAIDTVKRLWASSAHIPIVVIENPVGCLSTRWMKPTQTIQPYEYGDDASKRTCLWIKGAGRLIPTKRVIGRFVEWPRGSGKMVERWANQTDAGQNRLSPSADRWRDRSETYPGIAAALADQLTNPSLPLFGTTL